MSPMLPDEMETLVSMRKFKENGEQVNLEWKVLAQ